MRVFKQANWKRPSGSEGHLGPVDLGPESRSLARMYSPEFLILDGSESTMCSKSIDIRVDVAIVTTCVIHVDERVSPFLDCLGLNMTYYSDSRTYKAETYLVVSFPLSSWLQS